MRPTKPKRYVLPPNWQQTMEYHACHYRNCKEQAAFVMLLPHFQNPFSDEAEFPPLIWLCPQHHYEIEVEITYMSMWPAADRYVKELLRDVIRETETIT